MKPEHWIPLVVGGIILAPIAFLGANVFDMKGILSSVKTKVDATDIRVTRIPDVLPEVKARVAREEINHAIEGFVAVSNPEEQSNKKWVTTAAVYNRNTLELRIYTVALDIAHKDYMSYVIAGKLRTEKPYDSSFSELVAYSHASNQGVVLPMSLNQNASFVFRSSYAEDMSKFIGSLSEEEPRSVTLRDIRNWHELTENIDLVVTHAKEPNN